MQAYESEDERHGKLKKDAHRRFSIARAAKSPARTEPAELIHTAGRMSNGAEAPSAARIAATVVGRS